MDDGDVLNVISGFLSVPDLVYLGCTCRRLRVKAEAMIGARMPQWKELLDEKADKLNERYSQKNPYKYQSYQAFWDASMEEKRARIDLRIEYLQFEVYSAAATKSGQYLNSRRHEFARTNQGGRILLSSLHLAAAFGDVSLCRLLLDRGADINPNILISSRVDDGDPYNSIRIQGDSDINPADCETTRYDWGFITPLRLGMSFGNVNTADILRMAAYDGDGGTAIHIDGVCSKLPDLPSGTRSSWTSMDEKEIFYQATTMLEDSNQEDEAGSGNYSGPLFRHNLRTTLASLVVTYD